MLLPWVRKRLLNDPKRFGRWGQDRSEKYLLRKGCKTIARNYAVRGGEMDLVMADPEGTIAFVEVKTRQSETFAPAKAAVNYKKRQKMIRTAKCFLREFDLSGRPLRFDVITVLLGSKGTPVIHHYPNAFVP
ncbi:MAG: YraN family protein [Planctomycetes bacterium]|nr:YraN family protein [Planctomycetota bacterium]